VCACVRFTLCWFHTFSALRYSLPHYSAIAVVRLRLAAAGSLWSIVYLSPLRVYWPSLAACSTGNQPQKAIVIPCKQRHRQCVKGRTFADYKSGRRPNRDKRPPPFYTNYKASSFPVIIFNRFDYHSPHPTLAIKISDFTNSFSISTSRKSTTFINRCSAAAAAGCQSE
jgi:hypothetical protein